MSEIEDGGPAFPVSSVDGFTQQGMSLRDWFAGQALVGLELWAPDGPEMRDADGRFLSTNDSEAYHAATVKAKARYAYRQADAMLAAREPSR